MSDKTRTRTQYRLSWLRTGNSVKSRTFYSRKVAERRYRILTSDEPWREWEPEKEPGDYWCCKGTVYSECGCGGVTMAEATAQTRKDLPPIEWIKLESRSVITSPFVSEALP